VARRLFVLVLLAMVGGALSQGAAPVSASGGMVAISAGFYHTCGLTTAGGVKCWGGNGYGQLGNGTTTGPDCGGGCYATPVDVVGLASGVAAISAGFAHTCALTTVGGVKCWGENYEGELGNGTTTTTGCYCIPTPADVSGLTSGVAAISNGGSAHTCAVTTAGGAKCWGLNTNGQLGNGTTTHSATPVDVMGLSSGVAAISSGGAHTCALTTAGGVKCWGYNYDGDLGNGTITTNYCSCVSTPVDVVGLGSGVVAISAGSSTCALTTAGGVKCWGSNSAGALGIGTSSGPEDCGGGNACSTTPVDVVGLSSGVTTISAGGRHACARTEAGGLKCWGQNDSGQLGSGTTTTTGCYCIPTPADVNGLSNGVNTVEAGGYHTCALTTVGGVKCWGQNLDGRLGNGTTTGPDCGGYCSATPVDVVGLTGKTTHILADFKQDDPQWNQPGQGYDHLSGGITAWGCLLSSVADVLNYWGVPTDPVTLNNAMVAAGWPDGMMSPRYVTSYSHLPVLRTFGNDPALATSYLTRATPVPVIVHLNTGGDGHWVVLTGVAPGGDFNIVDPASSKTLLSQYTPSQAHWTETWIINGGASVGAEAHSPVAMLLTDPLGRRTGYDPLSGTILNEIPSSAYGVMGGIENDVTNAGGTPGLLSVYTNDPIPGTYTLEITGTGTGPYEADLWSSTNDGALTSTQSQGNATPGSSATVTVDIQGTSVGGITSLTRAARAEERRPADRYAGLPFAALAVVSVGGAAGAVWLARRRVGRR
jgi:alpha-tubulin suppressor-like RCC1 family protein